MSDDFGDRRDNSPSMRSFEEWLDQQAEQQGISREELFERLISSYWTLNEMVQLLDDSDNNTSLADLHPENRSDGEDDGAVPTVGHSRRNNTDDPRGPSRSDRSNDRRRDPQEDRRRESRDDRRRESRNDRREDRSDRSSSRERVDPDRIADLRDRLDELEDRLDDERERGQSQDKALEAVADRLSGIETDLEELATESETARESLAAEYESLADRLDDLEADVDGRHKQLANEQERLRTRLDAEFDDLETILEYLVSQTDDLDAGLTAVEQRHDDELSRLQREQEALQSLMEDAAAHDVHVGECGVCGKRVALDLLADPYCSACDSLFTGIEERSKWLFFSDVVVTAEEAPSRGGDPAGVAEPTGDSGIPNPAEQSRDREAGGSAGRRSPERTGSNPDRNPSTGRSTPAEPDSTRSTASGNGPSASVRSGSESTESNSPDPVDFERADDHGNTPVDDDPTESGFSFGDPGADADSAPAAGDDAGSDAGTAVDDPFGNLEDLKREERRDDEE